MKKTVADELERLVKIYNDGGYSEIDAIGHITIEHCGKICAALRNQKTSTSLVPVDWPADFGDQFWKSYPNKKGKTAAMKALHKVAIAGKTAFADLMNGVERYKRSDTVRKGFVKHPATWLNAGCWMDEDGPSGGSPKSFFEIAAGR